VVPGCGRPARCAGPAAAAHREPPGGGGGGGGGGERSPLQLTVSREDR